MKTVAIVILALVILFSSASCNNSQNVATSDQGGTSDQSENALVNQVSAINEEAAKTAWEDTIVRFALQADPGTLGPYDTNTAGRKQTLPAVYETLGYYQNGKSDLQGVLAKEWYEDGENSYVFELYDYIYDSNGNQITSDDVIYSIMDAGYSCFRRYAKYIDSMEKIDDYKFRMTLNTNAVGTLEHIVTLIYIIDQDSYEASGDGMTSKAVGSGPYEVTNYQVGSSITLVARDDYWQTEELRKYPQYQNVKTIECPIITEAAQMTIALETGAVDLLSKRTASQVSRFMDNSKYGVNSLLSHDVICLNFNCHEGNVCSDLKVRQAIAYAIDNDAVLTGVVSGYGQCSRGLGNEVYPDYPSQRANEEYYDYNPDKARELLEEAGYENGLTVKIMVSDTDEFEKCANIVQAYLNQVGITAEIVTYEETLVKNYIRDFSLYDICLYQNGASDFLVSAFDQHLNYESFENLLNDVGIQDDTLQDLIKVANDKDTHTEENMYALDKYVAENCYMYGLYAPYLFYASSDIVTSIGTSFDYWLYPWCCTYAWNS